MIVMCSVHTKLWVDAEQGEDEGEFLIFLLYEESYEADKVVKKEWSQHRCCHLGVSGETTHFTISTIGTVAIWIIVTHIIIITFRVIIRMIFTIRLNTTYCIISLI